MARIVLEIKDNEYGEVDVTMRSAVPLYNSREGYYPYTDAEDVARQVRMALFRVLCTDETDDDDDESGGGGPWRSPPEEEVQETRH